MSCTSKKDSAETEDRKRFIEFAPVGLYEAKFDPPRFVWVNEEMCRILGYTREELLEMNPLDFTDEAGKELFLEMVKRNLAGERVESQAEFKIKTKDGKGLWVSINATFTRKNGVVDGALVVAQDITERKEIERSLRESWKKYQDLIETTSDFVWEVDAQGRYTYCSPQMEKLWGLKPADMIGKSPFDRMSPASKAKASELFAELVKSPKPFSGLETSGHDREGRVIFYETDEVPFFDERGRLLGFRGITRDVTERKKAEQELIQTQNRLSIATKAAKIGIHDYDIVANSVQWDDRIREIWGVEADEPVTYETFIENVHPDDRAAVQAEMNKALDPENGEFYAEYRVVNRKDKAVRWVYATGKTFFDDNHNAVRLIGTAEDTTERKKAEEALRESEERFRVMADGTPSMLWVADEEGKAVFVNKFYKDFFNVDFEHVKEQNWQPLLHPDDKSEYIGKYMEALHKHEPFFSQARVRRGNGEWRWIESNAAPRFSKTGDFLGHVGVSVDITDKLRAELSLRENEERLKIVAEAAKVMVYETDVATGTAKIIRGSEELIGYKPDEVNFTVEWVLSRMHPDDVPNVLANLKKATGVGKQEIYSVEYRFLHKDGHYITVKDTAKAVRDSQGKTVRLIGGIRDITRRRENEGKIKQYSKHLERLVAERTKQLVEAERLAAIGATAGMVGHDIRNPLQAITGDLYLVRSDLNSVPEGEVKEGIKESLEGIEKNVEYIEKIVQDLQDFAKPLKSTLQQTDVEKLCHEVLFKNEIPENIVASCEVRANAKKVIADPDLLKRILNNLVSNSVQAMPQGGKLEIQSCKDADAFVITVADTGVGIPEEVKPKLFKPLFTTKARGQGFGLAVVKRMTETLGGTVTFESEVSKGTKFVVRLPQKS